VDAATAAASQCVCWFYCSLCTPRTTYVNVQNPCAAATAATTAAAVVVHLQKGGIRAGWFHIHRAVQCLAVLLALAGFILALVSFNVPWSNMSADSTPHRLYNAHRVLGVVVIALSILQVGGVGGWARGGGASVGEGGGKGGWGG